MKRDPCAEKEREQKSYKLWVEYLKRSIDYKDFCAWKEMQKRNRLHRTPVPNKYKKGPEGKELEGRMEWLFLLFGNIHAPGFSFDNWWANLMRSIRPLTGFDAVLDYSTLVGKDFDILVAKFKESHGRNPGLQEFKKEFLRMFTHKEFLFVMVYAFIDGKEIEKKFREILKERKKDPSIKALSRFPSLSQSYLRLDELERHLRIYDLSQKGLKVWEIIEIDPGYRDHNATARRLVYLDVEKTKRIIRNVEQGIFPGKYE